MILYSALLLRGSVLFAITLLIALLILYQWKRPKAQANTLWQLGLSAARSLTSRFTKFSRYPVYKKIKVVALSFTFLFWFVAFLYPPLNHGLIGNNPWLMIIVAFLCFHISMMTISIYLHRSETHRGVRYNKYLRHFFRFWLWLGTGIDRGHWVAVHRYHHQHTDTEEDPHSPTYFGIYALYKRGIEIYNEAYENKKIKKLAVIMDNDWLEKHLYSYRFGVLILLFVFVLLFGLWGIPLWLILMSGQILSQNFIINGLGHHMGYRNFDTNDNSRNVSQVGILVIGEELHNNHHKYPSSPRFSVKRGEFDLGWTYILLFSKLGMAKIESERVAPRLEPEVEKVSEKI